MAQNQEHWLIQKAKKELEVAEGRRKLANEKIPDKYKQFLVLLAKPKFLANLSQNDQIPQDQVRKHGLWVKDNRVYVNLELPYFMVDGKVEMARDEHREAGKKLDIETWYESENKTMKAKVVSELLGTTTGSAVVNIGGGGVDNTNPIENAETSAIGRALSFLGYGLIGIGVESLEEVLAAMQETKVTVSKAPEVPHEQPEQQTLKAEPQPNAQTKKDSTEESTSNEKPPATTKPTPQTKTEAQSTPKFEGIVRLEDLKFDTKKDKPFAVLKVSTSAGAEETLHAGAGLVEILEQMDLQQGTNLVIQAEHLKGYWVLSSVNAA